MKILIDKATVEQTLEALEFESWTTQEEDTIKAKVKTALKESLTQPVQSEQKTASMKTNFEMAKEAGLRDSVNLERFAELVRAEAQAEEREACANLVDHILKEGGGTYGDAIRARGNT